MPIFTVIVIVLVVMLLNSRSAMPVKTMLIDADSDLPMVMIVCGPADSNAGWGEEAGKEEEEVEGGGWRSTSGIKIQD